MARKKNYLLYIGIAAAIGLGVAYYKKWPPLMKFLHAPKAPPAAAPHPAAVMAQPQQAVQQQGVHPMGAMPGAIMPQQQAMMPGGFGYGYGIPQVQQPMIMPQTMPMAQYPYQPTMMMAQPTLMPGMPYGQVV